VGAADTAEAAWPTRRKDLTLVAVAATLLHGAVYLAANRFYLFEPRALPLTAVDRAVPYWPWTVFVYLSDYVLVFVTFQTSPTRRAARRFVVVFFFTIVGTSLVHLLYPVTYPRELFALPEGLAGATRSVLAGLQYLDQPTSCLPSMHVAACTVAVWLSREYNKRTFPVFVLWLFAIAASTLTTKQHYLVDVVAGFVEGWVVVAVVERAWPPPRDEALPAGQPPQ